MQGTHPVQSALLAIYGSFPDAPGVRSPDDYCLSGTFPLRWLCGLDQEAKQADEILSRNWDNIGPHIVSGQTPGAAPKGACTLEPSHSSLDNDRQGTSLEPTFSPPKKPKEEPVIDEQKFDALLKKMLEAIRLPTWIAGGGSRTSRANK